MATPHSWGCSQGYSYFYRDTNSQGVRADLEGFPVAHWVVTGET